MQTYIVRVSDPSVREVLVESFKKVGKPRSIKKTILVETAKSKSEIEQIPGVVKVREDIEVEFGEYEEQELEGWALPRICGTTLKDQHWLFRTTGIYKYNRTGKDVDIYIADTGMRYSHDDFKRKDGTSKVKTIYPDPDSFPEDREGDYFGSDHGSSVGACVAGNTCGVAKEANLFNIWVLESSTSNVLKGIDRVLEHHLNKDNNNPSILNMSFGARADQFSDYLYDETKDLVESGIICVACAHNYNEELSTAPAIHPHVVSVGSTNCVNEMSDFSNYGKTVDILAPGSYITTVNPITDKSFTFFMSGTSFSSPYIAGILALIVQDSIIKNEEDVNKAIDILYDYSRKDFIDVKENTVNRFSYSLVENEPINKRKCLVTVEQDSVVEIYEVEKDNTLTITLNIPEGYEVDTITNDKIGGTLEGNQYITNSITEDCTYEFYYKEIPKPPEPRDPPDNKEPEIPIPSKDDDKSWFGENKKYVIAGITILIIGGIILYNAFG